MLKLSAFAGATIYALVFTGCAFAQTAAAASPSPDFLSTYIVPALGTVVTVLIGWGVSIFSKHTGVAVSAQWQNTIQSAAMTGISLGMHEIGAVGAASLSGNEKLAVVGSAMKWINSVGAPDAVKALGLKPADVQNLVAAKLNQAITAGNAPASAPVATSSVAGISGAA